MAERAAYDLPGYLLGFALGGFFDGILLHQILQWHHLLSALEGRDLRFQVAADGYFHLLMYVVAALGVWLLWRAHGRGGADGRRLLAAALVGFGGWHVLDSVLSHWVLGIHRIRMDGPDPLLWDLLWFAVFGLAPLLAGAWMRRSGDRDPGRSALAPCLATALALGAGWQALQPPSDSPFRTALFAPGVSAAEAFLAVAAIGGRVAWTDATGQVVAFEPGEAGDVVSLYARGAILVSGSGLPSGCFDWAKL